MLKIYLSHSIRGMKGNDATDEDMALNNERIISIGKYLRSILSDNVKIHIPAEMEDFAATAWKNGYLSEDQLLEIDCLIIDKCDMVLCHVQESLGDELQGGREVEVNHAIKTGKPHFIFEQVDEACLFIEEHCGKV